MLIAQLTKAIESLFGQIILFGLSGRFIDAHYNTSPNPPQKKELLTIAVSSSPDLRWYGGVQSEA